jgi:hypothetical protein
MKQKKEGTDLDILISQARGYGTNSFITTPSMCDDAVNPEDESIPLCHSSYPLRFLPHRITERPDPYCWISIGTVTVGPDGKASCM